LTEEERDDFYFRLRKSEARDLVDKVFK
jgi:hypothetical protein